MIRLSKHFTLTELTRSATAARYGIKNVPDNASIINLRELCQNILEPVRLHYNIPFSPSSGFRSAELNSRIGSSGSSQHLLGQAVDFEIPGVANRAVADWIKNNLIYDQLILEFHQEHIPSSGWIHCSYTPDNRMQALIFDGKNYSAF